MKTVKWRMKRWYKCASNDNIQRLQNMFDIYQIIRGEEEDSSSSFSDKTLKQSSDNIKKTSLPVLHSAPLHPPLPEHQELVQHGSSVTGRNKKIKHCHFLFNKRENKMKTKNHMSIPECKCFHLQMFQRFSVCRKTIQVTAAEGGFGHLFFCSV